MSTAVKPGLFGRKPTEQLSSESEGSDGLRRSIVALDLTALGIGAIIGTGIFVIIGEAIGDSGPAIALSFVLAGLTCFFSALSYSELASAIPVSGSAYTYAYATMGELIAWIIGWDLILEYGVSVAAVAVGWGAYLKDLLDSVFGIDLPSSIAGGPDEPGGVVNVPAVALIVAVGSVLCLGVKESARTNTIMVITKLGILVFFIVVGVFSIKSSNYTPFFSNGLSGTVDAASVIFFAYIGFDAVSTSSEEAENPGRDLPRAIIGSLLVATVVYILVSLVAVGLAGSKKLDGDAAPLTTAIRQAGVGSWAGDLLSVGALIAITSVVLTVLFGQTRITYSMARDGLLPRWLGALNARRAPMMATIVFGALAAVIAAFLPLDEIAKLVNIGTLFAFLLVNIGVVVLRRTQPDLKRAFRVPFVPVFPIIGALLCVYLMSRQPGETWIRFVVWLLVGMVIYVLYGRKHSRLQRGEAAREL